MERKIFVGGLPQCHSGLAFDSPDLSNLFWAFGPVRHAWVQRRPGEIQHRGFGFVIFDSASSVESLLQGKASVRVAYRGLDVEVKRAVRKQVKDPVFLRQVDGVYRAV